MPLSGSLATEATTRVRIGFDGNAFLLTGAVVHHQSEPLERTMLDTENR